MTPTKTKLKEVSLYCDGACSGNPGPGGWGTVLIYGEHRLELSGGTAATTNNRMELIAALEGLKKLKEPCRINLYSDSRYLIQAFTDKWLVKWQANAWQTSARKPVLNVDLWQELLLETAKHEITWNWVKGHATNEENNRCDFLARTYIEQNYK